MYVIVSLLLIFKWISDKELVLESKGCYCVCVCCENMLCRVKIVYIVCNIFLKYIIIIFLIYIYSKEYVFVLCFVK